MAGTNCCIDLQMTGTNVQGGGKARSGLRGGSVQGGSRGPGRSGGRVQHRSRLLAGS